MSEEIELLLKKYKVPKTIINKIKKQNDFVIKDAFGMLQDGIDCIDKLKEIDNISTYELDYLQMILTGDIKYIEEDFKDIKKIIKKVNKANEILNNMELGVVYRQIPIK